MEQIFSFLVTLLVYVALIVEVPLILYSPVWVMRHALRRDEPIKFMSGLLLGIVLYIVLPLALIFGGFSK